MKFKTSSNGQEKLAQFRKFQEEKFKHGKTRFIDKLLHPMLYHSALVMCEANRAGEHCCAEKGILKVLPDLIFSTDIRSGKITGYYSSTMEGIYDPTMSFIGKTVSQSLPPEASVPIMAALAKLTPESPSSSCSYWLEMPEGSVPSGRRHYDVKMTVKSSTEAYAVVRDNTQLARAIEREKLTTKALEEIFDRSPIAIEVYNSEGILQRINPACARLFGIAGMDAVKGFNLFKDPNLSEEMLASVSLGESVSYPVEFDFSKVPYRTSNRGKKNLEVHVGNIGEGTSARYIVQIVDLSEKVKVSRALEESVAATSNLLRIIIHDVKNAVSGAFGFAQFLLEGEAKTRADVKEFASKIFISMKRAIAIADDVGAWHNAKSIIPSPKSFDLSQIVEGSVILASDRAQVKKISITNNIMRGDYFVFADENMVGQVFQNLISNAVKFTPRGGHIVISAVQNASGNHAVISVTDNGVGMKPENLARLFKFDRTFTTNGTEGEPGTGFGMSIVNEFVEKNGGNLGITSQVGTGTSMTFTLPLSE